ncbi:UbiA family prenyltransferase [Solwaraspora sp. WMMD406]|uniref:UbiA family prenyltransferase n=1 Tax=Solwaraspora sp. WMMD406 TaxID=3016095 RepID=UPI00241756E0|nr:UbiA family prenyltransferase [Solwaraspora sp. WMMD406]MDG4765747.1 UbiA family prenyltransferase [Solwaraspora sp. WMMD406]
MSIDAALVTTAAVRLTTVAVRLRPRTVALAWSESRPLVQAMFQLRFMVAAVLAVAASGLSVHPARLAAAAVAWLCATWHVYLLNGVSDRVADQANASRRPVACGRLPSGHATALLSILAGCSLVFGLLAGWRVMLLAAAMMCLGSLYSMGRRAAKFSVPGSMAVIAAGGLATYLAGWYAAGGGVPSGSVLMVAMVMSLWMSLAGMTKDLPDVCGDRLAGRRTLPVVLGERRARSVMALMVTGLALTVMAIAIHFGVMVPFAVTILIGASAVVVALIGRHWSVESRIRAPYRRFMVTQYGAHLGVLVESLL